MRKREECKRRWGYKSRAIWKKERGGLTGQLEREIYQRGTGRGFTEEREKV